MYTHTRIFISINSTVATVRTTRGKNRVGIFFRSIFNRILMKVFSSSTINPIRMILKNVPSRRRLLISSFFFFLSKKKRGKKTPKDISGQFHWTDADWNAHVQNGYESFVYFSKNGVKTRLEKKIPARRFIFISRRIKVNNDLNSYNDTSFRVLGIRGVTTTRNSHRRN